MKKILLILVVVGAIVGGTITLRVRSQAKEKPEIQTAKVERGNVVSTVTANGTLQPLTTVDIKSKAGGRVDVLAVDVGDTVEPGKLIAKIDPTDTLTTVRTATADMDASRARVGQAEKNLRLQKLQNDAQIRQAEESLRSAKVRLAQAEKQAAVQPKLTASSIAQAQANLDSARQALIQLETATQPQTRAQVQSTYEQAASSQKSAEESLSLLEVASQRQERAQAGASYQQAKANLEIAEKEMERQKGLRAQGFVAQSAVDSAQNRYDLAVAQEANANEKMRTLNAEMASATESARLRVEQAKSAAVSAKHRLSVLEREQAAEMAAARARVTQAQAQLDNARTNAVQDDLKQGDVAAARAAVAQAEASLSTAKANALQAEIRAADITTAQSGMASSQARLQNATTQYEQTVIVAPRSGVILQRYVEQGTIITSGTSAIAQGTNIVQLGDTSRMFVEVLVDEADIGSVEVDQTVDITVDAYPSELFEGKVTRIDPQAQTTQNVTTILVKVEVDNPDARLKPGMNASCEFIVERAEEALYVPSEAVKEDDNGKFTVTVLEGEKQTTKEVETGITGGDSTEIKSGLKEGETVITAIIEPTTTTRSSSSGGPGSSRGGSSAMRGMPGGGGFGGRR